MKKANLSTINLNLLNVLHALFSERSTTRAAKVLYISQPAVSYSLKRLRTIFDDDLLYSPNKRSKMELTQFAMSLTGPLEEIILNIQNVFSSKDFNPATSKRKFKLALTDYTLAMLLPKLYIKLSETAPDIDIETVPFDFTDVQNQLELNEFDIAIGDFKDFPVNKKLSYIYLFKDEIACVLNEGHPVLSRGKELTLETFAKYPCLIITQPNRKEYPELFRRIKNLNIHQKKLEIHNSNSASQVLKQTNLISFGPAKILEAFKDVGITTIKPDFIDIDVKISLCRNKNTIKDEGIQWLIKTINEIAQTYNNRKNH